MIVCLFDIDGTLLSSGGAGKAALEAAFVEDFGVPCRHHVDYSGRTDRSIGKELLERHNVEPTSENWQRLLAGYLNRLPQYLAKNKGGVLPGITSLLENLRQQGDVAIGLLTGNVRAGAKLKLGHYELYHHFAFGGFGDEHHDRDSVAHEALAAARSHLNGRVVLENTWVIGDTPLDVKCARAIGAKVAAVATGYHSREQLAAMEPDLVFDNLGDATELLERWR